jgi:hypothetical protein
MKMEDTESAADKQRAKHGAKEISKTAQIAAAFWIVSLTILKGFGIVKLEIDEIIYSGISIAAIFMPVYFSIWLEKIRDIRLGK